MTHTSRYAIEVKGSGTTEQKVEHAKAVTAEQRLKQLKVQLKQRLPAVTDGQLASLGLSWRKMHFAPFSGKDSRDVVTVTVVMKHDGSFDGKAIVEAAAAILEPEINPP